MVEPPKQTKTCFGGFLETTPLSFPGPAVHNSSRETCRRRLACGYSNSGAWQRRDGGLHSKRVTVDEIHLAVGQTCVPNMEPWYMETWTTTCGPFPDVLFFFGPTPSWSWLKVKELGQSAGFRLWFHLITKLPFWYMFLSHSHFAPLGNHG